MIDVAYWQQIGTQLGWAPSYRDPAWNTSPDDSEPRQRGYIDYYIIHHGASTSEAGMVVSMQPGGRTVTAQWILCTDGKFRPNIPVDRRAYTSSSWLDDIANTVETVNTSGDPTWGINDLQKMAHALNAVALYRTGKLKSLTRTHIIGHYEVLGISGSGYSTACPGPDMQLDLIVELANAIEHGLIGPDEGEDMPELIFTQASGAWPLAEGDNLRFQSPKGGVAALNSGDGRYQFTVHVYGEGLYDDAVLELELLWHNPATKQESPHYVERIEGSPDGTFKRTVTFVRDVVNGYVVVGRVRAVRGNPIITLTGCEALKFKP